MALEENIKLTRGGLGKGHTQRIKSRRSQCITFSWKYTAPLRVMQNVFFLEIFIYVCVSAFICVGTAFLHVAIGIAIPLLHL